MKTTIQELDEKTIITLIGSFDTAAAIEVDQTLKPVTEAISKDVVAGYMRSHDYGFTTLSDGSVRWAIWRYMDVTVLT